MHGLDVPGISLQTGIILLQDMLCNKQDFGNTSAYIKDIITLEVVQSVNLLLFSE